MVLVDCDWIVFKIIDALYDEAAYERRVGNLTDAQYIEVEAFLDEVQDYARLHNVSFCRYAYHMVGVLEDQASYYISSYSNIKKGIDIRGYELSTALTLQTNVSMSAPLESQFKTTSSVSAFLDGTLFTIIIFLGILSAMLLYSLMLSDVDSKTYDYAMLRALGFRKRMLIVLIIEQSLGFAIPGLTLGYHRPGSFLPYSFCLSAWS